MERSENQNKAVITADIIGSTLLKSTELNDLLDRIDSEFIEEKASSFWVMRGDSFQWLIEEPKEALKKAFLLRSVVNLWDVRSANISSGPRTDVRLSIGVGPVTLMRRDLTESTGPAFVRSGRGLEALKSSRNNRLSIRTGDGRLDDEFSLTTVMLSAITSRWSYASVEVLYWYLKGFETQKGIARKIGIGQSSVQRRMEAMHMDVFELFLGRYSTLISDL